MKLERVTINRPALVAAIKARILTAIAAHAGTIPHTNRDGYYSPSKWWQDEAHTDRRTLATSASLAVDSGGLIITLNYSINPA